MTSIEIIEWKLDIIKELVNLGVGRGAKILNDLLHTHVRLKVPEVIYSSYYDLDKSMPLLSGDNLAVVDLDFTGDLEGVAKLIFSGECASQLAELFVLNDSESYPSKTDVLTEIGNILLNSIIGTFSNALGLHLNYSVPTMHDSLIITGNEESDIDSLPVILATTEFSIQSHNIQGKIAIIFKVHYISTFLEILENVNI